MLDGLNQNGTGGKRYANFAAFRRMINRLDWSLQAIPRHNAPLSLEQPSGAVMTTELLLYGEYLVRT